MKPKNGLGKQIFYAYRVLLQHKLRSSLSIIGIVLAVAAVLNMLVIAQGARRETLEQIEQLGTNCLIIKSIPLTKEQRLLARRTHNTGISLQDVRVLTGGLPEARYLAPLKEIPAEVAQLRPCFGAAVLAVNPAYQKVKGLQMAQGRFLCQKDMTARNRVCVLGEEISQELLLVNREGGLLHINGEPFKVVGILKARRMVGKKIQAVTLRNINRCVLIPLSATPLSGEGKPAGEGLDEVIVAFGSSPQVRKGASAVAHIMQARHDQVKDFDLVVPVELLAQAQRTQKVFNVVLGGIAAISLLVGGIGIMNMMLVTVSERTKEIGIRRAVGADRIQIILQFLLESTLLTFSGGLFGVVLGVAGAGAVAAITAWPIAITFWSLFLSVSIAALVGIISGLYPAISAACLDPAVALRTE